MPTAAEILESARALYLRGERTYRDTLLDVGRKLHEYVLAYLREGDGVNENTRMVRKITRKQAMRNAADSLGTKPPRIGDYIKTAMVADLLSDGALGNLGHASIYRFGCFIGRKRQTRDIRHPLEISCREEWACKPKYEVSAKALFRRAVAENMTQLQVVDAVARLFNGDSPFSRRQNRKPLDKAAGDIGQLKKQLRLASPGDVAELIVGLIEESADPPSVAICLQRHLERFASRKKRLA